MDSTCHATGGGDPHRPGIYKVVGIVLAVSSGIFIGSSFVLKKTGLLKANVKYSEEADEGYGYLKNAWWWSGMTLMIIGEICNFVAYAFVDAILVTPLGALSVVITTILSAIFLKERLSFVGKVGCFSCIIGSVVIVLNAPQQSSAATIQEMQCYVISPGFLTYAGVIIVGCTIIALWAGPRYGKKSMLVYLSVCSLIGGLSVVATQGLGAAILSQINGTKQYNQWFLYVLLVFVVATLVTEIVYLNKALNIFNAAIVTPTYYVYFTSAVLVTSAILFRGFHGDALQIITIIMGFFQICAGVVLLQLSKSSKDVPDSKVFSGDLDQVRTVGEQEEQESEPKADAIRGTAALIRSLSKSRKQREQDEARKVHHERLEPVQENELIEWDGIRRRKTVLEPGQTPPRRTRTVHPPLGLTRFPSQTTLTNADEHDPAKDAAPEHVGLFSGLRSRAQTILRPNNPRSQNRVVSGASATSTAESTSSELTSKTPYALSSLSRARIPSGNSTSSSNSGYVHISEEDEDLVGDGTGIAFRNLPPELRDTEYKGVQTHDATNNNALWSDRGVTSSPTNSVPPTPPPHYRPSEFTGDSAAPPRTRRTFSFQNLFSRDRGASDSSRPGTSSTTDSVSGVRRPGFFGGAAGRRTGSGHGPGAGLDPVTEEERLGLVTGDSSMRGRGTDDASNGAPDQPRSTRDAGFDDDESSAGESFESSNDEFEDLGGKEVARDSTRRLDM